VSCEMSLQQSLYDLLSADVGLATLGVTVQERMLPEENGDPHATFPVVLVGEIAANQWDTNSHVGFDVVVRLHTWSSKSAKQECRAIQAQMYQILHRQTFAIVGFNLVLIQREGSICDDDPSRYIHGVCEFRALIQKME
jgi:hypothetical protein